RLLNCDCNRTFIFSVACKSISSFNIFNRHNHLTQKPNTQFMSAFMWDMHQIDRLAEAQSDASRAKDEVATYKNRIRDLEFSLNRTALLSQAMWELLSSRLGIAESELLARVSEIDLRDGVADGRMTAKVSNCSDCGRPVNTKRPRCIY